MDNSLQGLLPAGNYTVCYALRNTGIKETNLAEECIQFDTEPLTPPFLILPADSSILENAPAQFSWIPPTPNGMFAKLRYEILITAINDGQSPGEALQENIPFFSDGNLYTNLLNYPSSATTFNKDKWYAWQVVARDDKNYAGKSEVWVFKINNSPETKIIAQMPFVKMKKNNPEKGIAPNGVLKVSYINETADNAAIIKIIDMANSLKASPQFSITLKPGENLIEYNLKKIMQLQEGKVYEAQLINARQEKWIMQFEHHQY
ncbi:MAG: hypothetical protein IPJ81_08255 [Chitinophagaceae bacterium]|nr:hypothetical protein [Chitinophagaceae bacterium]